MRRRNGDIIRFEYSAGAVVYKVVGGRRYFLFLLREDGRRDLPKGNIEKGESAQRAAVREIREESGLRVRLDASFRYNVNYWYMFKGQRTKKRVTMFLARVGAGARAKASWEHAGFEWLDYDAAMKKLSFREWKELVKRANDYLDKKSDVGQAQ